PSGGAALGRQARGLRPQGSPQLVQLLRLLEAARSMTSSLAHPSARARAESGDAASVTLKVPFHDCDPLFVVWHGRYFQYLEVARSALFAKHACDVEHVRSLGYRMYITEARCRYMHPLSYNDEVRVTARFTATRPL